MAVAFCFMAYRDIDHPTLWQEFFGSASNTDYTIWLHSKESIKESAVPSVRIVPTKPTEWGEWSIVEAQQHLLECACTGDPRTKKVVLLSSDSVPLWNFRTVYDRIMANDMNWVSISERTLVGRPSQIAFGSRTTNVVATGSQWVILTAASVAAIRGALPSIEKMRANFKIPDERVYHTFFLNRQAEVYNSVSVHADFVRRAPVSPGPLWIRKGRPCPHGPHRNNPFTYCYLTETDIQTAKDSGALFMRKICPGADLSGLRDLIK